jgi:Conserved TM helix/Mechanosensitive ion channel
MDIFTQLSNGVLNEMIMKFSAIVPKLFAALMVLLIGRWIAKTVRNILQNLLTRLKIDTLADGLNEIDLVQNSGMRVKPSSAVSQIVYFLLMLIFTLAATDALGVPAITQLISDLMNYMPSLLSAGIVLLIGLLVSDMLKGIVVTACQSLGIPSAKTIGSVVFYFLFITIAISALAQAKIQTEFIAANMTVIIGAFSLAFAFGYGFASRDLVANYLAGFYNKNKVRIGDDVQIIGERGKVVMIDSSSMILQTHDRAIVVPLSKLTTEKVEIFYPDGQEDFLLDGENAQR